MKEQLTHWKKNNDSRYISGEDLKAELKGLKAEMVVMIDRFQDAKTFDQNTQSEATKTGFYLKELNGKELYKPVILNNTNAKFCVKEFDSEFMEHWLNKPFVLYAQADKRHGFVARFKKYYAPAKKAISDINFDKALEAITAGTYTKEKLSESYLLTDAQKAKL